jgi:hypothetical protein
VGTSGANVATSITGAVQLLTCRDNTFKDISTNNFAITAGSTTAKPLLVSPFTPTTSAALDYSATTFSGSMYFDGTGDALTGAANGAFILGTADFTVEFWEWNEDTSDRYLFSIGDGWSVSLGLCLIHYQGAYALSGGGTPVTGLGTVKANQWNHIALSRYGGNINLYVNGIYAGLEYVSTNPLTENTLKIGTASAASWPNYKGYIADLRILKGTALYKSNFFPGSTPNTTLANTTLLLGGSNAGIMDATRTIDMETVADAKVTPFSPYNGNYYSVAFSSTGIGASLTYSGGGTGDITHELWIKPDNTSRFWAFCPANGTNGIGISTESGYLNFWHNYFGSAGWTSNTPVSTGVWTHVAIVRKSTTIYFYVNGVKQNTTFTSSTIPWQAAGTVGFGYYPNNNSQYNTGSVSNMRIVDGTAIYDTTQATITVPTSPLTAIANTKLLVLQSNKFIDNSSSNFTITNTNASIQTSNPFQVNTGISYYFDGTGDGVLFPGTYWPSGSGSAFTVEMWIYPMRLNCAIARCNGSSSSFSIAVSASNQIILGNVFVADFMTSTSTVPLYAWSHITITRTTANLYSIYINGSSAGTPVTYNTSLGVQPMYLGYNTYSDTYSYFGYLTDLRVTLDTVRTVAVPTTPLKTN